MYKGKKILAFIPARDGSKRIPHKNSKKLHDIPLFQYSVNVAKESQYIDDIIVSSDSMEILSLAHELGCINNDLRPKELSGDKSRIIDSILYEIERNKLNDFSAVVLLQPTFPNRTKQMLDSAIEKYFENEKSLITVVKAKEQPVFMRVIEDGCLKKILSKTSDIRSQEFTQIYRITGNIYINNITDLTTQTVLNENIIPFEIEEQYDIDIDTMDDFRRAESEMKK